MDLFLAEPQSHLAQRTFSHQSTTLALTRLISSAGWDVYGDEMEEIVQYMKGASDVLWFDTPGF